MAQPPPSESKGPTITIATTDGESVPPGRVSLPGTAPASMRSLRPNATSIKPDEPPPESVGPKKDRRVPAIALVCSVLVAAAFVGARSHPWRSRHPAPRHYVSGTPQPRITAGGSPEHWPTGTAVPVVIDPSVEKMSPDAKEAIVEAFATWQAQNLGTPDITLSLTDTPGVAAEDGVNRILYAPITVPGYEKAVAITLSYAADDGVVTEADMIVNSAFKFTVLKSAKDEQAASCGGKYDVQDVVTHEAGHFLGMGEDMTDTSATMYIISDPCQVHKRVLTTDDTKAMKSLYADVVPTAPESSGGCQ